MCFITLDDGEKRLRRDPHRAAYREINERRANMTSPLARDRWVVRRDMSVLVCAMYDSVAAHRLGVRRDDVRRDVTDLLGTPPTDAELTSGMRYLVRAGLVRTHGERRAVTVDRNDAASVLKDLRDSIRQRL